MSEIFATLEMLWRENTTSEAIYLINKNENNAPRDIELKLSAWDWSKAKECHFQIYMLTTYLVCRHDFQVLS